MTKDYAHELGPVTVIGPNCFASADGSVICWLGENFYRVDELPEITGALVRASDERPAWWRRWFT